MDAELAVCNLARLTGVVLGRDDVSAELRSHPAYPSLLAVVHTLDGLGFEHVAAAADAESLAEVAPAIAHTTNGLIVVESVCDESVVVADENGRRSLPRDELEAIRTGPVVFLDGPGRETHLRRQLILAHRRRRVARWSAWLAILVWIGCLAALAWTDQLLLLGLVALGGLGLASSVALVGFERGTDNLLGQALCKRGPNSGCDAVLRSPMGEMFGVRLSEVGLCFFLFQHAATVLAVSGAGGWTFAVAATSLLVAPFPVFSVLYQALVIRQWCRLCLLVQLVLVAQAAVACAIVLDGPVFSASAMLVMVAVGVATSLAWIAVRRAVFFSASRSKIEVEMLRIRRAPARIGSLLATAGPLEIGHLAGDVVRGQAAGLSIGLVLSLGCDGCRAAFLELDDLLERFSGTVDARIRFAPRASTSEGRQIKQAVVRMASEGDHDGAWNTLKDHFRGESKARHRQADSADDDRVGRVIEEQEAWCRDAGIQTVPTCSVNGRLLDHSISIADLSHFIALRPRAQQRAA